MWSNERSELRQTYNINKNKIIIDKLKIIYYNMLK